MKKVILINILNLIFYTNNLFYEYETRINILFRYHLKI